MDTYEFARGVARVMDRVEDIGLAKLVERRKDKLSRITDPNRPYRTLAHIVVDSVAPEMVQRFLPQGMVTVRQAAKILIGLADHSRVTPRGAPAVVDRDLCLFVRRSVFAYFLHLLAFDRYAEADDGQAEADGGLGPRVEFRPDNVRLNAEALRRWTLVIIDPELFRVVSRFLATVPKDQYGLWYFRAVQASVSLSERPSADDLEFVLRRLREVRTVN